MNNSETIELPGGLEVNCDHSVVLYNEIAKEKLVEKNHPVPVFVAEMKIENPIPLRLIPYTSYLSQVHSKPVDMEIPLILQTEQQKMVETPIAILGTDSNADEVLMWTEKPIVITIDSSDEDVTKAKMELDSMESKDIRQQEAAQMTALNADTDDDEILMWVEAPTVINIDSSDEDSNSGDTEAKLEPKILQNACEDHPTQHVNPLALAAPELNKSDAGETSISCADDQNFASHQRTNQRSLKRSFTDVPECNKTDKSKNVIADQCSLNHKEKRIKRMKSSSGSNRVSKQTNSDYMAEKNDINRAGHEELLSSCHNKLRCAENHRRYHHSKSTADRDDWESSHSFTEESMGTIENHKSRTYSPTDSPIDNYESGTAYSPTDSPTDNYKSGSTYVKKTEATETFSDGREHFGPSTVDSHDNEVYHQVNKSKVFRFSHQTNNRSRSKFERKFLTTPPPVDDHPPDYKQVEKLSDKKNKSPEPLEFSALEGYARIKIPKHCARNLMSNGYSFFSNAFRTHKVKVRMEWEETNDILVVVGSKVNQERFHEDLLSFVQELEDRRRSYHINNVLPKSKVKLIKALREALGLLVQPLGDVNELFERMKKNDQSKTKNGTKIADRARKHLNMILMGQTGLRDGQTHLDALKRSLKDLMQQNDLVLTKEIFNKIHHHFTYIFSPYRHDNYPALIAEHHEFKIKNKFPALNLDATFLKIDK